MIFLDEPTLGLDPAGQRQVLALIAAVARERGTTVLLSTHQLAEVEDVCDRVVVLNRGTGGRRRVGARRRADGGRAA